MNKVIWGLAVVGTLVAGCSSDQGSESTAGVGRLRIDVACSSDQDCPTSFECEVESEHGVTTSFCQSHDEILPDGTGAQCPAGFELEVEHGTSFCKPHGGHGGEAGESSSGPGNADGDDDLGHGGEGGDDRGHGGESGDDHGHAGEAGDDQGHAGEAGDDHGSSGPG